MREVCHVVMLCIYTEFCSQLTANHDDKGSGNGGDGGGGVLQGASSKLSVGYQRKHFQDLTVRRGDMGWSPASHRCCRGPENSSKIYFCRRDPTDTVAAVYIENHIVVARPFRQHSSLKSEKKKCTTINLLIRQ